MSETRTVKSLAAKAARLLLVFALVFGTSLQFEMLVAYGVDDQTSSGSSSSSSSSTTPETPGDTPGGDTPGGETPSDPTPPPTPDEPVTPPAQTSSLTDFIIYQSFMHNGEKLWKPVIDKKTSVSVADGAAQFVAVPVLNGAYPDHWQETPLRDVSGALYVNWTIPGADASTLVWNQDAATKVLTITPKAKAAEPVKVECTVLTGELPSDVQLAMSPAKVEFDVHVLGKSPLINSVDFIDDSGAAINEQTLTFDKPRAEGYQFKVRVGASSEGGTEETFTWPNAQGAAYATYDSGVFGDMSPKSMTWKVEGSDEASITQDGLLTMADDVKLTVTCTVTNGSISPEQSMSQAITVIIGNPPDESVQGEAKWKQNQLHVVSTAAFAKKASTPGSSSSSSSASSSSSSGTSSSDTSVSANAESTSSSSSGSGSAQEGEAGPTGTVDQTYAYEGASAPVVAVSDAFSTSTKTVTMRSSNKSLTITGEGFQLADLLEDAFNRSGVDMARAPIESISFVDYRGVETTIPYASLKNSGAMLAVKSFVHTSNDTASSSSSSSTKTEEGDDSAMKLLDNTRYRLLMDASSASLNADDLRYINEIRINGPQSEEDDGTLAVRIDYTPVPKGVNAEFVAVPTHDISGSWKCVWEVSEDGGVTHSVIEGEEGQTLSVPTNDKNIGKKFRVRIINSASGTSADDPQKGTSEWVELKEGAGLVLSYNPPRAGDMAIFRTSLYGFNGDASQLQYVWEWTDNGGQTWKVIEGEDKPTLKIPTDPVDSSSGSSSSSSSSDSSAARLIYIRARAVQTSGQVMVSNVQPLTVRVGDADTNTGGSDDSGTDKGEDKPKGGATDPSQSGNASSGGTKREAVKVSEVSSITMESSAQPAAALDPSGTSTPSTPQSAGTPTQLYVNDSVTEAITEQQEAAENYAEATVPGARWTKIKLGEDNGDDVRRVLEDNPLAPLVIPFTLGITVAGGLEKLLFFRRQLF